MLNSGASVPKKEFFKHFTKDDGGKVHELTSHEAVNKTALLQLFPQATVLLLADPYLVEFQLGAGIYASNNVPRHLQSVPAM